MDKSARRICILGSTGSIGTSTLDVLARHPAAFEVFALTAHSRVDDLAAQCARWQPRYAVLRDEAAAGRLRVLVRETGLRTEVLSGPRALDEVAAHPEVDIVMAAIVGATGLSPCLAAARGGKRLLLANKEALVVGGAFFMQAVSQGGAQLLPIDSEHSAIFQCLPEDRSTWQARIDHIVLTASGGPFRARDPATLREVTPDQACAHPNWVMGRKISVDSATMMNKALEVIEARWLFDLAPSCIRVVIHPQSVIHSMVEFVDGSVLGQLGSPDMRIPIAYALAWPERIGTPANRLDLAAIARLEFEAPDVDRFPALRLARQTLEAGGAAPIVLNAANEVAVASFLDGRIGFTEIAAIVEHTLGQVHATAPSSIDDVLEIDRTARQCVEAEMKAVCQ